MEKNGMAFSSIVDNIEGNVEILETYIVNLTKKIARNIMTDVSLQSKIVNALLELQTVRGVVLGMHPDSFYSEYHKEKSSAVYNKVVELSERNSNFIDIALDVFAYLKSLVKEYVASDVYCYNLLTNPLEGTRWSFYLLVCRILSDCKKIISYLKNISPYEKQKGILSRERIKGETEALPPPYPPPPSEPK